MQCDLARLKTTIQRYIESWKKGEENYTCRNNNLSHTRLLFMIQHTRLKPNKTCRRFMGEND